jgi:hypothetical protein
MKASSLIIGLLAGSAIGYGAFSILKNQPATPPAPAPKSVATPKNPESDRIARLEKELADLKSKKETAATTAPEEKPADGQPPDLKKILKDATPLIQSLSTAFEPQRKEMVARFIDDQVKRVTELANLSPDQAAALKTHLEALDKENQDKMKGAMGKNMNIEELMAMGRNGGGNNPQKAVDDWATANLSGDQADTYKTKRLTEKTEQITKSANSQVENLGRDLGLDESQKDKVFNILVQTDRNYDPSMALEGVSATDSVPEGQSRDEAIAAVLTPDQKAKYDAKQAEGNKRRDRFRQMLGVDPGAFPGGQ